MFESSTEKYMAVAGQSFMNDYASDYYKDVVNTSILGKVINGTSALENVWNMYTYGGNQLNRYYNIGVSEFIDKLPSVSLTGTKIDLDKVKAVIESQTGYNNIEVTSIIHSPFRWFDIKWTMNEEQWYFWYLWFRWKLQNDYQYNEDSKTFIRNVQTIQSQPAIYKMFKIDWDLTGDPLGIDYTNDDNAFKNTDYNIEGNLYQSSPFIVSNEYTAIKTIIEQVIIITVTNKDITTDYKNTKITNITTTYNEFNTQLNQSSVIVSNTTVEIPKDSEQSSTTTTVIDNTITETLGKQNTWFIPAPSIPNLTHISYWTDKENPSPSLEAVSYYFAEYKTENNDSRVWIYRGKALPVPTKNNSNEGEPYSSLSVLPIVTLMNNDKFLSKENDPERYKQSNRILNSLNMNVDMLRENMQTSEAPKGTSNRLRMWLASYLTDDEIDFVDPRDIPNPDYNNPDKPNYNPNKPIDLDETIPNPDFPLQEIIDIINNKLKILTVEESTVIIDKMLIDLKDIKEYAGDGKIVLNPNYQPDNEKPNYDPNRYIYIKNPPEIKPWERAFIDILEWIPNQKKEETAIGRIPDDLMIMKRLNEYCRDKLTIVSSLQGEIEDIFIVSGVNPISTSYKESWDWSLPKYPSYTMDEITKQKIRDNKKKEGVGAVSKILFNYFTDIYKALDADSSVGGSSYTLDIEEKPYFVKWSWNSKGILNIQTIEGNKCEKGQYIHICTAYKNKNIKNKYGWMRDNSWYFELKLYYQFSDTHYKLIHIDNGSCEYTSKRHGKSNRVPQDEENPYGSNKAVVIPLPLGALKLLSVTEKAQLYPYALHTIMFAIKKVKLQWYQTLLFRFILMVVMIVITVVLTILFPPAGVATGTITMGTAIALQVFLTLVISIGMQILIQVIAASGLSKELKAVVIAVALVVATYYGGGFSGTGATGTVTTAVNIINIATEISNIYIGEMQKELANKATKFKDKADARFEELKEAGKDTRANIDINSFVGLLQERWKSETELEEQSAQLKELQPIMSVDTLMFMNKDLLYCYDLMYSDYDSNVHDIYDNCYKNIL